MVKIHNKGRKRRSTKVRHKIKSSKSGKLRLSVFRSNRFIYAQIIDDKKKETLVSVNEKELSFPKEKKLTKLKKARLLGLLLGQKAKKFNIAEVVFDRDGYKYHGRLRAFAEEARNSGLLF